MSDTKFVTRFNLWSNGAITRIEGFCHIQECKPLVNDSQGAFVMTNDAAHALAEAILKNLAQQQAQTETKQ